MIRISWIVVALIASTQAVQAQVPGLEDLIPKGDTVLSGRMIQLIALLTILSVAPGILIMVTSFTRFIVALSFLRTGMGLQSTPANLVMISLALFMTFHVMAPTFEKSWDEGVQPMIDNKISEKEAFKRIVDPFRAFMLQHVREKDLMLFDELANRNKTPEQTDIQSDQDEAKEAEVELRVLVPAFMISELRRGFEICFLIVLPFLVIDLIVATLTMSMGMMMLPPTVISLPFNILFFILIDGWNLLVGGLVRSFF